MMRFAWIILLMAAVGAAAVWLRAGQNSVQASMYRLEAQRLKGRRTLWEQQLQVSELAGIQESRKRSQAWALELREPGPLPRAERAPTLARRRTGSSSTLVRGQ